MPGSRLISLVVAGPILLALAVAAGAPGNDDQADPLIESLSETTSELESLRAQISTSRQRISQLNHHEVEVRRTYDQVAAEIEETSRILGEMAKRERSLQEQGAQLAARIEISREEFQAQRDALGRRLRILYMRGNTNDLRAVLAAENVSDLLARVQLTRTVARVQAAVVRQTRVKGRALVRQQRVLDSALVEIWQSRAEAGNQAARMELLMAEKSAALREVDLERQDLKNSLLELDLSEQKLTYMLEDLERQRETRMARPDTIDTELIRLAGELDWPVQGDVLRGFGRSVHPRFKTVTLNNGLNIGAPVGSPVAAVAGGTVEFCNDLPGFGRCVILDHGEGYYTLYAHLDRAFVAAGTEVARGQVIAEVGRPTAGEAPQLYFEVRHGRTPLDPADWLLSR